MAMHDKHKTIKKGTRFYTHSSIREISDKNQVHVQHFDLETNLGNPKKNLDLKLCISYKRDEARRFMHDFFLVVRHST